MVDSVHSAREIRAVSDGELDHRRGALVIVILCGLLFGVGWLSAYLFLFLQQGAPH